MLQEHFIVVDRAESIALHERMQESSPASEEEVVEERRPASEKKVQGRPCDGPGRGTMMYNKADWHRYYHKFYCKSCFAANNWRCMK